MNTSFSTLINNIRHEDELEAAANAAESRFGDAEAHLDSDGIVGSLAHEENAKDLIDQERRDEAMEVTAAFEEALRECHGWGKYTHYIDKVNEAANNQLEDLCDRIVASENVAA